MRNGKYSKRSGVASKTMVMILALVLVIGCTVGGTLAWLTDTTTEVKNTFTTSDIDITLAETTSNYKMLPGADIAKDPKVTVKAGSEKCWLFVKVEKANDFDKYLTYTQNPDWQLVDGDKYPGVYYYKEVVDASAKDESFYFLASKGDAELKNGYVTVKGSVTKEMMESLNAEGAEKPALIFTAYAAQAMKNNTDQFTAAEAWANNFVPATTN